MNDDRCDWREGLRAVSGDVVYVWHAALHSVACMGWKETISSTSTVVWPEPGRPHPQDRAPLPCLEGETAAVFEPLLAPARYKGAHGGRGSGKSHFFAGLLIEDSLPREACARCASARSRRA